MMADFTVEKNKFDMRELSSQIEKWLCKDNVNSYDLSKVHLVIEEYLSNILFPNFDGEVKFSISRNNNDFILIFSHRGNDYMNKITDNSFLSFKILDSKTKEKHSYTKDGITTVEFIL